MDFRDLISKLDDILEAAPTAPTTPQPTMVPRNPDVTQSKDIIGDPADIARRQGNKQKAQGLIAQLNNLSVELDKAISQDATQNQQIFGVQEGHTNISKSLVESFGYTFEAEASLGGEIAKTAATVGAGYGVGKLASKIAGKAIPGVGTALSWSDAYDRAKKGDFLGAGLAGLAGAAYLAPGVGTAVGTGLDMVNIGRDLAGDEQPADSEQGAKPDDNKLAKLQQIIGAKPDGIMGPETKQKLAAWQQQQGIKADGIPGPETYGKAGIAETISLAEQIKLLQSRLDSLNEAAGDQPVMIEKNGKMYALFPDGRLVDEQGNLIDGSKPDLPVVGSMNVAEAIPGSQTLSNLFRAAKSKIGSFIKPSVGKTVTTAAGEPYVFKGQQWVSAKTGRIATKDVAQELTAQATKGKKIAAGAGAAAAGLATGYGMGGGSSQGAKPSTTGSGAKPRSTSTGGGAGGITGAGSSAVEPVGHNKLVQEIVRQMKETIGKLYQLNDPAGMGAIRAAQSQISKIEGLPAELIQL